MDNNIQTKAQDLLTKFVDSVSDLIKDTTALEVNTMVVAQITGSKFNPWEAYQAIYSIRDKDYRNVKKIPDQDIQGEDLYKRYENLFEKLEREYFYLLIDPGSKLFAPKDERVQQYYARIKWKQTHTEIIENDAGWVKLARPILPNPLDSNGRLEMRKLFDNKEFLLSLRKIIELKVALDSYDVAQPSTDIIYAQTVMQLDGDIINRYDERLFQKDKDVKDTLMKIHSEGVIAGEKQWHGLLDFMLTLVRGIANLSRNGR